LGGVGWLRARVLGANDGIVSTSSLILGVAAAHASQANILLSGTAALVAGAMSMATGEYVSVHSQADTEDAALAQERAELEVDFAGERRELTEIYVRRGLDHKLAAQVAVQLMAHDALGSHARDELGLSTAVRARPAGGTGIRGQLFSRRHSAAVGGGFEPAALFNGRHRGDVAALPADPRRMVGKGRRR
jgi:VIT1/CCC1 family predicted Fe2+/Mn2+ transporter